MEQYSPDCSRNIMAFWKSTAKQRSARGHSIKKVLNQQNVFQCHREGFNKLK